LPYSLAVSITDRTAPILLGTVAQDGLALAFERVGLEEIFVRQMNDAAFDVAECSLASYLIARARGDERLTAIPVFLSREFRHNAIYVRADSPAHDLAALRGVRFGLPEYQMTAAIWVRALLREAGVANEDVRWVTYRPERIPIPSPATPGTSSDIFTGLANGEVDAIFTARRPPASLFPLDGSAGTIRRLFDDPWGEERAYYERTRIFPIMHLVALRASSVRENPTLARAAYEVFLAAKRRASADLAETIYLSSAVPFLTESVERSTALLGADVWPYGVGANWAQLETFMTYLQDDGLLERRLTREEVFAAGVLDT
jgi:4,5-dihydroxyphthalate decarboxylase